MGPEVLRLNWILELLFLKFNHISFFAFLSAIRLGAWWVFTHYFVTQSVGFLVSWLHGDLGDPVSRKSLQTIENLKKIKSKNPEKHITRLQVNKWYYNHRKGIWDLNHVYVVFFCLFLQTPENMNMACSPVQFMS